MAKSSATSIIPTIVGIYGIPGSGKTCLLRELEKTLGHGRYQFYEGSQVIDSLVPGGLSRFQMLSEEDKFTWRQRAIETIRDECLDRSRVGIVTGHFMFWSEEKDMGQPVLTPQDFNTYTHVLYLNVAAELTAQRRQDDERTRPSSSVSHLRKWQDTEISEMRQLCGIHRILFCSLSNQAKLVDTASQLLRDFQHHTEARNLSLAKARVDEILGSTKLKTVLVLDADKTLAAEDTGEIFWTAVGQTERGIPQLKSLFGGPLGYTYTAFRQAALFYEEVANERDFDAICAMVASKVTIHAEFLSLLQKVAERSDVGAVVVTSGLRHVWEHVLKKADLSETVKVIGGGRIADVVVTADVKLALVSHLQDIRPIHVIAFGDSPLDLPMLKKADQAIIVVGQESSRSKSMDAALLNAIEHERFRAHQILLPPDVSPRLNVNRLPLMRIDELKFLDFPLHDRCGQAYLETRVFHATNKGAAKLLMTPTRDASIKGPSLRNFHSRIGWYLAAEFLTEVLGLEEHIISHVQGHKTDGFRLRAEKQTLIVALMRGGEPMALGVSEFLPEAMFLHAKGPDDLLKPHLDGQRNVILVDSVVNSGATIVQFVQRIRPLAPNVHIIVIAGVVQSQCVVEGTLANMLADDTVLSIIALRLSENKFTGQGTTDTGNRLFNTTQLA
ncbi:uracil phosphoribosyltransferase-domain-containing protein [Xylaria arbuscula]|nr:uracil phosphoribosyltransferase-domain-containing protein [Xylaria arbuscula]